MFDSPWRVLHVVANHEKRVAQHLMARSLEHYLPLYSLRSKWTDRVVDLERPLFTGYIFVRFAREARLSVVSAPGVLRLLGSGIGETVSAEEIERIRTEPGHRMHPAAASHDFHRRSGARQVRCFRRGGRNRHRASSSMQSGHHSRCNQAELLSRSGSR